MSKNISINSVSHTYHPSKGNPVFALDNINLEIKDREFMALLGPSGCGKSTLLFMVGGFLPVSAGTIKVGADTVVDPSPERGIVFQHFALLPWKTVLDNVLYGLEKTGVAKS